MSNRFARTLSLALAGALLIGCATPLATQVEPDNPGASPGPQGWPYPDVPPTGTGRGTPPQAP